MTETFAIVPAQARALWLLGGVGVLVAALSVLLLFIAWSTQHARVELAPEGMRVRADVFGRVVGWKSLDLERARVTSLATEPDLRPRWRVGGTGLPGYRSGWFKLRNGEKALLALTRTDRVLYVPTRDGYSLLLSVEEPERLMERLRAVASTRG